MTSSKLACIILAAGKGTRMKSDLPKVLHPLAGRPMVRHVLEAVAPLKPDLVIVVVGPGMEAVAAAVAPHRTVIQERQLGTGDAVRAARPFLEGFDGDVLVVYGDTPLVTTETLDAMVAARRGHADPALVVLGMRPDDPGQYGRLVLNGAGGLERIVEFSEADETERSISLCNGGLMALDGRRLFGLVDRLSNDNSKGEFYLTDTVAIARELGYACAVVEGHAEEVLGVNSRAELAEAEAVLQRRLRRRAMDGGVTLIDPSTVWLSSDTRLGRDVTVGPSTYFGPGVTVEDGVEIKGFCHIEGAVIRSGAIVGPFARLRPGAEIGREAHVGNFVEIKNAHLGEGAKANHLTYLGDAEIGARANIGAGTITCNYDGFLKHRTVIGEEAFIGSNSALVAPVRIGDRANVAAGSVITREVAADALAIERAEQVEKPGWARNYRARKASEKASKSKAKE